MARRRDVRGARRRRRGAVRDRAARGRDAARPSGGPGRSCTCACAGTTTRPAELDAWAARLEPFLAAGDDAFVFFRHDEVGRGPELARALAAVEDRGRPLGEPRASAARAASGAVTLGRSEHDEQLEPLGDVVEPVRDGGRDEDERAGLDGARPRRRP